MKDTKILETMISGRRRALAAVELIKETAKKFDGKVLNKRFIDAVRGRGIWGTIDNCSWGKRLYLYYHGDNGNIALLNGGFENITKDGRLDYEKFEKLIDKRVEDINAEIQECKDGIENMEYYEREIERIRQYADYINELIPAVVRSTYSMAVTIRTY